jgi:hypothetical protein
MAGSQQKLPASLGADEKAASAAGQTHSALGMAPIHVAVVIYAVLIGFNQHLLIDPDTFSHIAAGRWIWQHGHVPATDPFSFTMQGAPWVAHEWLAELTLAGIYGALGWAGVVAITAAATALTYGLLCRFLKDLLPVSVALLVVAASFSLTLPHILARPHVLDMPILVAWTICLDRARSKSRGPSYFLLPLMVLWANLHGGFVIGLGLTAVYGAEAMIAAPNRSARWQAARSWSTFLVAAALSSLITPYGVDGPLFAFHLSSQTYLLSQVVEWRSADFSKIGALEIWILGLLTLAFTSPLRLPLVRLAILLGLVHVSLVHIRNADLLALIAPIVLAQPLAEALRGTKLSFAKGNPPAQYYAAAAFALVMATGLVAWNGITHDDQRIAPTDALAAARAAGVSGPVLNAYGFGGYFMFVGIPPYVDGRGDLYLDAFMHNYTDVVTAKSDSLSNTLARYRIGWTLLQPDMDAVAALDRSPAWRRVYADDYAVVHQRIAQMDGDHVDR